MRNDDSGHCLTAQPGHRHQQSGNSGINVGRRRKAAEGNAQRTLCQRIGQTNATQHIGGLHGRRRACRPGRNRQLTQGQQQRLAVHTGECQIDDAGDVLLRVSV